MGSLSLSLLPLQGMYGTMDFDSTNAAHFSIATPAVHGGDQFLGGNGAQGAKGGAGRGRIESIDEESHNLDGTTTTDGGVGLLSNVATGGDDDDEHSNGGMSLLGLSRVVDPGTDLKTLDYGNGSDKEDKHPHHEFYSPVGSVHSRSVEGSVERRGSLHGQSRRSSELSNISKGNRAAYRFDAAPNAPNRASFDAPTLLHAAVHMRALHPQRSKHETCSLPNTNPCQSRTLKFKTQRC